MSAVPALPTSLPALDNTLGALYIGTCLSTLLYGVICVQTFIYITSYRARSDRWWLKAFVFVGLDTVNQGMMVAGMYRFLVSDFANPIALEGKGAGGGKAFFCWRIWRFSASSLKVWMRIGFVAIMLVIKLAASSGMAFDVIMTLAMIMSLHRARSGVVRSDHVITLLTLFTVNTNLITTSFLVLPDATVYGGIFFLIAKSYLNSFLAILNSREYLREKMDPSMSKHETGFSQPVFAEPASSHTITTQQMEQVASESAPANDSSTKV
ncbi:hypothetical protein F5146DRAFT_1039488 [Armillaria mellea]|nr:hypothetical protein F5146DRAFT_1039488 [Armillaria mellea]